MDFKQARLRKSKTYAVQLRSNFRCRQAGMKMSLRQG